jgi:hypothetical protein
VSCREWLGTSNDSRYVPLRSDQVLILKVDMDDQRVLFTRYQVQVLTVYMED